MLGIVDSLHEHNEDTGFPSFIDQPDQGWNGALDRRNICADAVEISVLGGKIVLHVDD